MQSKNIDIQNENGNNSNNKYSQIEIIHIDELKSLSNSELKYIRNGIYAYESHYFESGYYDEFEWYFGNIPANKFTNDMLSECQMTNVLNIRAIEKERGVY